MRKINSFKKVSDAISELDNGGRFYNILTKAEDGVISKPEVGKVAGLFSDKQKMVLFLDLSMIDLSTDQKSEILAKFDDQLLSVYNQHQSQRLLPSEAHEKGIISSNAILTGVPKLSDSKSDFKGFIMVPIVVGNITTFSLIPLIDQYDIYEIRDEDSSETFFIAHDKGQAKLPEKKLRIAGVFKELKADEEEKKASKKFLEAVYYSEES